MRTWDAHRARRRWLDAYAMRRTRELDATEQLVGALYACMDDFECSSSVSRCCTSPRPATAKPCGGSAGPSAHEVSCCATTRIFGPELRACARRVRSATRAVRRARAACPDRRGRRAVRRGRARRSLAARLVSRARRRPASRARRWSAASRRGLEALIERCGLARVHPPGRRLPGVAVLGRCCVVVLADGMSAACQRGRRSPTRTTARPSSRSTPALRRCRPARRCWRASNSTRHARCADTSRRPGPTSACCCSGSRSSSRAPQRLQRAECSHPTTPASSACWRLPRVAAATSPKPSATGSGRWRAEPDDPKAAYALALDLERQAATKRGRGAAHPRRAGQRYRQPRSAARVRAPGGEAGRWRCVAARRGGARRCRRRVARRHPGAVRDGARPRLRPARRTRAGRSRS